MEIIINLILITSLFFSISVFSEENKSVKPAGLNKSGLLKVLLQHYQSMTGAWFINKSCYILSYQETKD
jgi:hypothetical protein